MKSVDIYDDHLLVAVLQNIKHENRGLTCFGGCFQVCVCMCVCVLRVCVWGSRASKHSLFTGSIPICCATLSVEQNSQCIQCCVVGGTSLGAQRIVCTNTFLHVARIEIPCCVRIICCLGPFQHNLQREARLDSKETQRPRR